MFLDGVPRADIILPGQLPHLLREANLEIVRSKERSSILRRELRVAALFSKENAVTISLGRDGEEGMMMDVDGVGGGAVAAAGDATGGSSNLIKGAIVGPDMERKRKRPGRKRKKPLPGDNNDQGKASAAGGGDDVAAPDAKKAKTAPSSSAPSAQSATTTPSKPPPPKPKSARDVLRRIIRKYPEIADDPVYVAALRNVGLEVPSLREMQQMLLKQKLVAAAAAAAVAAGGGGSNGSVEVGSNKKKVKKDSDGAGDKGKKGVSQIVMPEDAQSRLRREVRELKLAVGEVA